MVQFYPWFNIYFPLFLGMVMYDNEFETKGNKNQTKDKIEPQHIRRDNYHVFMSCNVVEPGLFYEN